MPPVAGWCRLSDARSDRRQVRDHQWFMVTCIGPLATISCEPGQARKGAAAAVDLGAGVRLVRVTTLLNKRTAMMPGPVVSRSQEIADVITRFFCAQDSR